MTTTPTLTTPPTPPPAPPRGRTAWIVAGSLVTAIVLLIGTLQAISILARETTTEVGVFPAGALRTLDIRAPNGFVEVLGRDVDEVTVTAEIRHGVRRTRHEASVVGDVLRVRSSCPWFTTWCSTEYRVVAPARLALTAFIDNGRLVARDLNGPVRADGDNGAIELARLGGDLDVSTDNGRVEAVGLRSDNAAARSRNGRVHLEFSEPPRSVEARSSNGRVEVVVPRTSDAYRVDLDTNNGSTDVGVRTDPGATRSIVGRTSNGDVTVRYPTG